MSGPVRETDVVVVGGGAAGLVAAHFAGASGADTVLLERTKDGGRKILISGGGRCNVLPGTFRPERYVTSSSPNSLRRILRSWPLEAQRRWFEEELRIPLKHEPEFDKLFPVSDRARDVRDALVRAVRATGAKIEFETSVTGIEPVEAEGSLHRWIVRAADGRVWRCRRLVLATGGLSVPATGSDGTGLSLLEALGHTRNETYPALTPLLADPPVHAGLAGVTLDVAIEAEAAGDRHTFEGSFLFTHRGYSGPVVLNASHVAVRSEGTADPATLYLRWGGEAEDRWLARLEPGAATVGGTVAAGPLPERLARRLVEESGVPADRSLGQLRREERERLLEVLTRYPLPWTGDEGYRKAEVTGGGIELTEVDPGSLESRIRPGLHLCGELLDAFGPIGGHNFLWAWATGRAAGRAAGVAAAGRDD